MAHYQNQYGAVAKTDEYGNPIRHPDETGLSSYDQTGRTTDVGHGTGINIDHHEDYTGEKRGVTEKIKEKIPGMGHHDYRSDQYGGTATTGGTGYGTTGESYGHEHEHEHGHEKKGVMEKIKEKLPGGHQRRDPDY